MPTYDIERASLAQLRPVLRLALASEGLPPAELERRVTAVIEHARELSLDLSRQWVCARDGRVVAACACIEQPGRTATLLAGSNESADEAAEAMTLLVRHVLGEEGRRRLRLVQSLLSPQDRRQQQLLEGLGFRQVAVLVYMERRVSATVDFAPRQAGGALTPTGIEWITYSDACHDEFSRLIGATYRDSLDCPALTGLRDIEDIIAGHRSAGRFQPHRWLLARVEGRAAGCILMGENPLRPSLDLTYMGVHPDARRQGLGRLLVRRGLELAQRERLESMEVVVDAANGPALALYRGAGFTEVVHRRAMIRPLDSSLAEL